ncbi:MAG: pilus assembly protein [Acidimicrobiales bacterium]|jgi:hypothetical protein|nr:pilus assembly protein [Acidimicrobiales bacterium]
MGRHAEPSATRRARGDEGTALVELALVLPLLVLLVLGVLEYGRAWGESNTVIRAAEAAGRTAATQGPDRFADYNALQSVQASLASLGGSEIERVVIFRADSADGRVPQPCVDLPIADDLTTKGIPAQRCNVYSAAQVDFAGNVLTYFGNPTCTGNWDAAWCPTARSRGTDVTDPDFLGIYIKIRYEALTGIIGNPTADLTATSVFRLDPCITGVSCA